MFSCGVSALATAIRCSPNSRLLQKKILDQVTNIQFEPAVYRHSRIAVWLEGTVSFFVAGGKPHLRIFLNQEEQDLKSGNDFVAPQFAFVPGNSEFKGIYCPTGAPGHEGVAAITMDVDAGGKVLSTKIAYEH